MPSSYISSPIIQHYISLIQPGARQRDIGNAWLNLISFYFGVNHFTVELHFDVKIGRDHSRVLALNHRERKLHKLLVMVTKNFPDPRAA